MSDRVRLEVRDEIAYVTLTRGEKYNGLDWPMMEALVDTARQIRKDRSVRAVILQGEGKAFSAGLDFPTVSKQPLKILTSFLSFGKATNLFQEVCWCWRELPVPVIAVLHGRCYGGALQIALAADFRFATPDCEFSVMEAKWGLIPDMSGSVSLRELLPIDIAKRLTMTGETFTGLQAKDMHLVTGISTDPLAEAEKLAAAIKARSPDAVAATKALFDRAWSVAVNKAFAIERAIQARLLMGKNQRIVMKANFKKEAPNFQPRSFGG